MHHPLKPTAAAILFVMLGGPSALAQSSSTNALPETDVPSRLKSPEDGWFDVSGFLDEKYGFLPVVMPITEPAVGYGAAGGLMFLSKPLGGAEDGFGRPNISMVGGLGTENGSWGVVAGDLRHWLDDRLQTQAGLVYSSVNLDFYGIGEDSALSGEPLSYNLEPKGGLVHGKYRLGASSRFWAGLSYTYANTDVTFDAPAGTPGLPDSSAEYNTGGLTPSATYDSRDNMFTPTRGTYVEALAGLFSEVLGSDDDFQRLQVIAMQYLPLHDRWFFGLRGQVAASFGDVPFYLRPAITMRGVPILRYQGDEIAQAEVELRWQCWHRFSLVGFFGAGTAWNDLEQFENSLEVVAGGGGFRYELARDYGIHAGLDVAFSDETAAFYIQVGSAWARP